MAKKKKFNITVTAGHGGKDKGAVNGTITESFIATDMRTMLDFYLTRLGHKVVTDGEGQVNLPLRDALTLIPGSDLAIEIHTNAFSDNKAKGTECLALAKHKEVCGVICKAINETMGKIGKNDITPIRGNDGGWKNQSAGQHSRLAYVANGGIIVELFFITNDTELKTYLAKKWLVAKAIAEAIHKYLTGE